jgi:hypothetical protein
MQKSRFDYRWAHLLSHRDAHLARLNEGPPQRETQVSSQKPIDQRTLSTPSHRLCGHLSYQRSGDLTMHPLAHSMRLAFKTC